MMEIDNHLSERQHCEAAVIKPINSGIPVIMYALTKGSAMVKDYAYIKVRNDDIDSEIPVYFAISICNTIEMIPYEHVSLHQTLLNRILAWVQLNYVPLMRYWNDEYENPGDFY